MKFVDFRNLGVVTEQLDRTLLENLQAEVTELMADFSKGTAHNTHLAGNIIHEYVLTKHRDEVEEVARRLAKAHEEKYQCIELLGVKNFTGSHTAKNFKFQLNLSTLWVNFQQKHEFNPIHTHNGIYSFVIWLKIPYFMGIEKIASPGRKGSMNKAGAFEFIYTNILGDIVGEVIEADKAFEGQIVLFPARLNHVVYPFFSSDDYRISISGNLFAG